MARRRSQRQVVLLAAVIIAAATLAWLLSTPQPLRAQNASSLPSAPSNQDSGPEKLDYEVVNSFHHDTNAFLQGLLWHEGFLYESTGLEGRSSLRKIEYPSGQVLKMIPLSAAVFGEGLALAKDRLIQLTWQSKKAFVYDLKTFESKGEFSYETEGWGLTFDGTHLIMSDGSSMLWFRDPNDFKVVRTITVTTKGQRVGQLNELEYIEGEIWANIWQTPFIVQIDPATGRVKSFLDLRNILTPELRTGNEDVLNGIAYDSEHKRIFVSGKLWPRIFEIKVRHKSDTH